MAFTYQNLVDEALQLIGVLEPGNSFSTAQYADLTRTLQLMLDEWNAQYSLQRTTAGREIHLNRRPFRLHDWTVRSLPKLDRREADADHASECLSRHGNDHATLSAHRS
jgi:hypothetical protein